ncbi:uncharacterized protein LOC110866786 [Helianthus annuus]|uniref:uncharacterized protein LOC110866786 n=1 Tax=Helianthus annuus TaxID=4232 RepID=UPI0016533D47|nr:uncharacterized protein LOC110866786 [Helianthus annuus]
MLKRLKRMPILTDGWETVVSDLKLQKDCLLTFRPMNHFGLYLSSFVNGVCEQSYFTINRHLRLGFTIIEDSFVQQCFGDDVMAGSYEVNYKGSPWTVSTSKVNSNYVFSQGWTQLCNDLGVQEDDLLVFEKLNDVMFDLTVYRDEVEIRLSKKVESDDDDDDDVIQISRADYDKALFKDIEVDDNQPTSVKSPSGTVPTSTPKNVHVKETLKVGDGLHFTTTQDLKGKGKGKLSVDRSVTVDNFNKQCKGRKRYTTSDQTVKHPKKVSRNANKVSRICIDPEYFDFSRKAEYRLRLPVEVVNRAGLSERLQPISVQNLNGDVEVYDTKTELNSAVLPIVTRDEASHRRKLRKLYLDNKKSNVGTTSSSLNIDSTNINSTSTPCVTSDNIVNRIGSHNFESTPEVTNNVNPSPSSIVTSNIICSTSNRTTRKNDIGNNISTGITSTTCTSSLNRNLQRLSSGKRKLVSKARISSPIPMIDLTTDETVERDPYKGVSTDYLDHGDQVITCEVCYAKLWDAEKGSGRKEGGKICHMLCCGYAKVVLPDYKTATPYYKSLFMSNDNESKHFLKNIRRYNSMFAFTSMGGKVDQTVNTGNAPFCYRISGENYHSIGSLVPPNGGKPKFCQLYIYDTENELANRSSDNASSSSNSFETDNKLIQQIKAMFDAENVLVKIYRMVRDCFQQNPNTTLKLRLIGKREQDGRTYNLPTSSEVAALIVGDIDNALEKRDIVVETQTGSLKRISELHPSYLALQYPILFPYGDDGYRIDIPHKGVIDVTNKKRPNCTMREFFAYRVQDRSNQFSLILNSRRLFQQFLVDAYTMIESERLNFIRFQQQDLRSDTYKNIRKLRYNGQQDLSKVGKRIFLPSSFTGGSRYMMQNYLDAMAICKWYGYPDFFITITCNPKWPEVQRFLKDTNLNPEDRPDILSRIFKIKLDSIGKDLKDRDLFGKASAVVYTIEFQKRGLPHAHMCLFMENDYKLPTVDHVDQFISAEIPDLNQDPELYTLVKDHMIHGPCGNARMSSPCMVDRKCSKGFPKKFQDHSTLDSNGFPLYRRRDDGSFVLKNKIELDNRSVVPYNKKLLKRYQAHINVEWCNQAASIKYLFKYINKGPDRATVAVVPSNNENEQAENDEIKEYYDCRYISACEASWRIFSNEVNYRSPSVMRLPFHLPGQQTVCFGPDEDINQVLNKPSVNSSMFLAWMQRNQDPNDHVARTLTYVQFPRFYVWKLDKRIWVPRIKGKTIGRIHSVSPSTGEAYYLRILLNKVKGPTSFDDIKTVNGRVYDTFRDACYALGLLDDDSEYIEAIKEANISGSAGYIRNLFATMLLSSTLSRPEVVWESTWKYMTDDFLYRFSKYHRVSGLSIPDEQLKNYVLCEIEKFLTRNNSSLRRFLSMPYPDTSSLDNFRCRLINEELAYDRTELQNVYQGQVNLLTDEQRAVYEEIMNAVHGDNGGVFFVYGYGGTGKTFLWKTLSAAIRSKGEIVLNVASSGIASLLLEGGRTAHSRFHIPLNLNEDSVCHIKPDDDVAKLLQQTKLIIWDEAPMVHKHAFEALDRTMHDIFNISNPSRSDVLFGGKVIVFGGDFRQILPVVPNGGRQEIVNASLCSSYLWSKCKLLTLSRNMRLTVGRPSSEVEEISNFAKWLLDVGEGNNYNDRNYFSTRAILAPKNEVVHEINYRLLAVFPGEEKEYLSSDSLCPTEDGNVDQQKIYSPDVLNGLKVSGLPNHRLVLKVGVPVMLLRNIDQRNGLCNGTRLKVTKLYSRVIEAEIISGGNIGSRTFIPRMNLVPSDKKIPFAFQRRQFPITVCFAMTINKSQGQSLSKVGLYLRQPVFTHGQLYVALSRVTRRDGIKLLILDNDGRPINKTTNVVYKEIFNGL